MNRCVVLYVVCTCVCVCVCVHVFCACMDACMSIIFTCHIILTDVTAIQFTILHPDFYEFVTLSYRVCVTINIPQMLAIITSLA